MLRSRQKILSAAREEVDITYQFKKGKSRSKRCTPSEPQSAKRAKLSHDLREERIKVIQEELTNLKERLSYKHKRRLAAETVKNYKLCDEISEEIGTVSKKSNELKQELAELMKKDSRSKVYHKNKARGSSSTSSRNTSSVASDDSDVTTRPSQREPSAALSEHESGEPSDGNNTVILSDSSNSPCMALTQDNPDF